MRNGLGRNEKVIAARSVRWKTPVMSDPLNKRDTRWRQRFQNYRQALSRLSDGVGQSRQRALSELERQGLIQAFEFTHELAWNVLKDYLEDQGFVDLIGSKNATREAFKNGLLQDGQTWMDMINARNLTSHTYNTNVADDIVKDILSRFHPAFVVMESRFAGLEKKED
jgi:nucleotidyltransferase substrate binding protein (TIGR01987 family)